MEFGELATLIAEHIETDVSSIKQETTFESLGIDSLETVEMIMELEEKLGVELELEEKLETVGDFFGFVQSKVS